MFHMNTNLMCTPCFQNTFHKSYISQTFQYAIMSDGMFSHSRVGHHCHLHPVSRIPGNITDDGSFILFYSSPYQSAILAFGRFIEELDSQICLGIRCFSNHQQARSVFINPVDKSDVRVVRIIIGVIFHMPGKSIDQRAMIIPVSRMHHQSGRLVDDHQIGVFINDIKGNIFRNNFIFITRTVHHHRDDIQRLHFIAAFHRFTVSHNKSVLGSFLDTVARSIDNTFEQIFVDSDHRLPFIHNHAEVFIKLGFVTDRFYIIQIIFQFIR